MSSATAANHRSLFLERKYLKLLRRLTVGYALPQLLLSVYRLNFRILVRTLRLFVRVCSIITLYVYILYIFILARTRARTHMRICHATWNNKYIIISNAFSLNGRGFALQCPFHYYCIGYPFALLIKF